MDGVVGANEYHELGEAGAAANSSGVGEMGKSAVSRRFREGV